MKKCPYCGKQYPENVETCPDDLYRLDALTPQPASPVSDPQAQPSGSAAEQRFWERMTFRQFGILLIRLQAVWFLFYGIIDALYVLPAVTQAFSAPHSASLVTFLAVVRVILHFIMVVICSVYAEPILSWLVKDLVPGAPIENLASK